MLVITIAYIEIECMIEFFYNSFCCFLIFIPLDFLQEVVCRGRLLFCNRTLKIEEKDRVTEVIHSQTSKNMEE